MSDALVRARDLRDPSVFITKTDSAGKYILKGLSPGRYLLEVEVEGQLAFRAPVEVRDPTTKEDVALVTSGKVPYVEMQVLAAADDAVVTINGVQVLRWGIDASEVRRLALTRPRNDLEVSVSSKTGSPSGGSIFSGRTAATWRYRIVIRNSDGEKWEYEDGQDSADESVQGKRFPVLRGTLVVDNVTGKVRLVNVDTNVWKNRALRPRMPHISF